MKMVWATWNLSFLFVNGGVWMRGERVMVRMLCAGGKWYVFRGVYFHGGVIKLFLYFKSFYIVVCSEARAGGC